MSGPTAVRIDGGEPVLEPHQIAVGTWYDPGAFEVGLRVRCTCGSTLDLSDDHPPLTVADLIWLAIEHRQQLAAAAETLANAERFDRIRRGAPLPLPFVEPVLAQAAADLEQRVTAGVRRALERQIDRLAASGEAEKPDGP